MKVLIDEDLPQQIRYYLKGHDPATVGYMRWRGFENGDLIDIAVAHGFDALLTGDQNIPHQQNIGKRRISVIILIAPDLQLETLLPVVPLVLDALVKLKPGSVVRVSV